MWCIWVKLQVKWPQINVMVNFTLLVFLLVFKWVYMCAWLLKRRLAPKTLRFSGTFCFIKDVLINIRQWYCVQIISNANAHSTTYLFLLSSYFSYFSYLPFFFFFLNDVIHHFNNQAHICKRDCILWFWCLAVNNVTYYNLWPRYFFYRNI